MPITLRIERLVLDGITLTPSERTTLAASLQSELTTLLRGGLHPAIAGGGAVPSLRASAVGLATPLDAAAAGADIARAVYSAFGAAVAPRSKSPRSKP